MDVPLRHPGSPAGAGVIVDVDDVDPFHPDVLADPTEVHSAVREAAPAVWLPRYRAWFTGRDAEVREVLTEWERFTSTGGVGVVDIRRAATFQKPSVILDVDPPEHAVTRRVLTRILSQRAMQQMRTDFERFANELVDELVERREFDAITDLAFRFPFTVLPDAVGLPVDGREHLVRYSTMYFNARAPDTDLAVASAAAARTAGSLDWVAEACTRERLAPGGFGQQIYEAADAGEIDTDTAATLVRTFLGGGVDTTVLSIGAVLHQLASHPDQWRLVGERRDLVRNAFDEALRLAPSVPIVGRTTTRATELGGVAIDTDTKVLCSLFAANRDPRRWDRGDDFDVTRRTAGQLGFGVGPHFCVGHAVARLESEVLLTALLDRVAAIEITANPVPELNNWLHGLRHLPVRVTPR
jgi:cytochrome P450